VAGDVNLTELLEHAAAGEARAADRLLPLVYDELRRLAQDRLRHEAPDITLQATAVVHEAYLKLVDQRRSGWRDRNHFFAVAAQAMRRILVDEARRRGRGKRGGGLRPAHLDEGVPAAPGAAPIDVVALDEALGRLAAEYPDHARLVELRVFGGYGQREAAEALGVSERTAERWWAFARAHLASDLGGADGEAR
jgi:RNA polymerase sigma-70 factor, ECF subfamily